MKPSGLKVIEFKAKGGPLADQPLSINGRPVRRADGSPVMSGELIAGKVYTVRSDGLWMPTAEPKRKHKREK